MGNEETKEPPKIGTYEYAISKGATEEQARAYVARENERYARGDVGDEDDGDEPAVEDERGELPKYFIHSTVRARHTRLKRMKAPVHASLLQHIGGLRIRRKRPVPVTEEKLGEIIHELRRGHAEGRLELRTADGRLVDLRTGEIQGPEPTARAVAGAPLDTAATDKPAGIPLPAYHEGTPLGVSARRPAVIPDDSEDEEDDWNENTASIPPGPQTTPPPGEPTAARSEAEVQTNPSGLPPPPGVPSIQSPDGDPYPVVPPTQSEPEQSPTTPLPGEGQGEGGAAETTPEETLAKVDEQIAEGGTNQASGETNEAEDETSEASDETETEEEQPPAPDKVPLPQVARRGGGKKRGHR